MKTVLKKKSFQDTFKPNNYETYKFNFLPLEITNTWLISR